MGIKVGEIGKTIRINAAFDMSGNTNLKLVFTKPDLTTLTVEKAGGVSAPAVAASGFNANEYWEYDTASGDIDQAGTWKVHGVYIDGSPKEFCGDTATFTVLACS